MAFLRNRAVNWINLHSGIQSLAYGMGGVFVLVFLLRAGVSIPASLCAMALIVAARFAIRPVVIGAARRHGLKPLVIGGGLVIAVEYPVLAAVHGVDGWLLAYCLVSALGNTIYWTSFHAYFAMLGDHEHRGHQISASVALGTIAGIVGPLIGAWTLATLGPGRSFGATGVVQALAMLPLLATPNVRIPDRAPGALRASLPGVGLFLADGWLAVGYQLVWQIALFVSLGANLGAYGGAMALAALVGAASGLVLGRHIDGGNGRRAVVVAFSAVATTVALRVASVGTPWLAVSANALGAFALCLLTPTQMVPVYNLAKASPCAFRFHVAAEGGWDVGCCAGCLVSAALLAHGGTLSAALALPLAGLTGHLLLLRRYYRRLHAW
jgi:hypothetical protein